jgi:hypothetical protein
VDVREFRGQSKALLVTSEHLENGPMSTKYTENESLLEFTSVIKLFKKWEHYSLYLLKMYMFLMIC